MAIRTVPSNSTAPRASNQPLHPETDGVNEPAFNGTLLFLGILVVFIFGMIFIFLRGIPGISG